MTCLKCGCDLTEDIKKLNELKSLPSEKNMDGFDIKFCPNCGEMLFQECPDCGQKGLSILSLIKSCPNCKREIVFCEECGKINRGSAFNCADPDCGKILKVVKNVFLNDCADYSRTNVYSAKKREKETKNPPKLDIQADFSKIILRSGVMYFWKEVSENQSLMTSYNISYALDNNCWEEKTGSAVEIGIQDILNIEIFNQYILTSLHQKLLINYADTGELVKNVDIKKLSEKNTEIKYYKAAILNDNLIVVMLNINNEQEIISINIENFKKPDYSNMIKRLMTNSLIKNIIEVEANPVIINGRYAYFVGYTGEVYKIYICENNSKEFFMEKILVKYGALTSSKLCAIQIAAIKEDLIYLNEYSDENQHLFFSRNGEQFILLGSSPRFGLDKISFYGGKFFIFNKDKQDKFKFSKFGSDSVKSPQIIFNDFNSALDIYDYYIVEIQNIPYLIYMQRENMPALLKIFCRKLDDIKIKPDKIKDFHIPENAEFLIFENFLVLCNHRRGNNYILVQKIEQF